MKRKELENIDDECGRFKVRCCIRFKEGWVFRFEKVVSHDCLTTTVNRKLESLKKHRRSVETQHLCYILNRD